jgi:hypothetical protein
MCAVDGTPKLLVCPENCNDDVKFEDCTCKVDGLVNGKMDWTNLFPCIMVNKDNQATFEYFMPVEMLKDLTVMMGTASVQEGEMVESASTADIMFWLIHPAIERLLSGKRLGSVKTMGTQALHKWPDAPGDTQVWLDYSYYTFEEGKNPYYTRGYKCRGHGAHDNVLPKKLSFSSTIANTADTDNDGEVSNWEYYIAIDPNHRDGNDYVFDNFKWDHCS